ncbi:MAG: hypothetical protein ACK56I_02225 [bacterium]
MPREAEPGRSRADDPALGHAAGRVRYTDRMTRCRNCWPQRWLRASTVSLGLGLPTQAHKASVDPGGGAMPCELTMKRSRALMTHCFWKPGGNVVAPGARAVERRRGAVGCAARA